MVRLSTVRASAAIAAAVLISSAPALAGEIYSWRTDDGGYAFTDDEKVIPARYRDRVETRVSQGLGEYERLTTPDGAAASAYAERLANRLEHLRSLNRDLDRREAPPEDGEGQAALTVQAGRFNISVPNDDSGEGPVVVENLRYQLKNEMATRHNLVVRRGGKTLAVVRGQPLVTSGVNDVDREPGLDE